MDQFEDFKSGWNEAVDEDMYFAIDATEAEQEGMDAAHQYMKEHGMNCSEMRTVGLYL